jgi:glycosyltransferase involved in cell wall biosynthesis
LRTAGKAIFVTYQGDDARQSDYCREHFAISPVGEVDKDYYPSGSDDEKRKRIALFDRYADRIYSLNPDLLHVLPKRAQFLPYAHVNPHEWAPVTRAPSRHRLVIHAPSHRGVKGTRFLLEAVSRLRAEGMSFGFEVVEGLPRADARKIYEQADLVVDQLLVGWYGGFAVEVMALGKPVIAYVRTEDLAFLPEDMRREVPIIQATPSTIYEVLKRWLKSPLERLTEAGARGRRYVERWHDPSRIAGRMRAEYETALREKARSTTAGYTAR